jgi:hypothetical protein
VKLLSLIFVAGIALAQQDPGNAIHFPAGIHRLTAALEIGRSNVQIVCDAGAVLQFSGVPAAVSFANATNVGMEGCTIDGGGTVADGILLRRAHHVSFRNVRVRNVTQACLRTKFSVVGEYTNFRCTINEADAGTMPVNGMVLGEDGPGEQTTASSFINTIVEGVAGDGIVLDSAANLVFTAGTSENHHAGWGMTIGPRSANITVIGMDLEDNLLGSVDTAGTENLFLNILSAGLFRVRNGARGNTLANSRVDQVTFDAGSYNNVMRENDYAILDGRAEPVDLGTGNSVYANYNAGTQRYAQGYVRFPVDQRLSTLVVTSEWSDVTAKSVEAGSPWRAVLIGGWSGRDPAATLVEATAAAPESHIGTATVLFRRNPATGTIQARTDGSAALRFTGALYVTAQ